MLQMSVIELVRIRMVEYLQVFIFVTLSMRTFVKLCQMLKQLKLESDLKAVFFSMYSMLYAS